MDNILRSLSSSQIVVDLGCGTGSFSYRSYDCKVIGIDISLTPASLIRDGVRIQYLQSNAAEIPLSDNSVDAVICNHTLEHFPYRRVLAEINRILNPNGLLWIAVPNGYSFDDALYRFVFAGGGHINRFRFKALIEEVQGHTELSLIQSNLLFSGFVYFKRPTQEQARIFPMPARALYLMPKSLNRALILSLNSITRIIDKYCGTRTSLYGWGLVFAKTSITLDLLPSYFNVCWKCGSGNDAGYLRATEKLSSSFGVTFYRCANCDERNLFFEPLDGMS